MTTPREQKAQETNAAVLKILSEPISLAEQIDAIAEARGTYIPGTPQDKILDAYTSGRTQLSEVLTQLADPIDEAYTSGHKNAGDGNDDATTESQLWSLWGAIIHSSRKLTYSPGRPKGPQTPLLELVRALKSRADPPRPEPLPVELENDWIWADGKLWSQLTLLGPAVREAWNDSPGAGAGTTEPEVAGWENANAFVALLTREALAEFWDYGIYALRDALERPPAGTPRASREELLDANVRAAAAWVNTAGREMWAEALENEGEGEGDGEVVAVDAGPEEMPWKGSTDYTRGRWRFWREKFTAMVRDTKLEWEAKEVAEAISGLMSQIEQEGAH